MLLRRMSGFARAYYEYRYWTKLKSAPFRSTPLGFLLAGNRKMQSGDFEPHETALLQKLAADTDVYIDVGANIGYFVCLMRSLGVPVVAFEPLQQNLDYLLMNVDANSGAAVEVLPIGLAAAPGVLSLYGAGTGASLIPHWAGTSGVLSNRISVNTLDNLIGGRFPGQRLTIKIDVEGAELTVLLGAVQTLCRSPAPRWLVEICLTENYPNGINPDYAAVFDRFFEHGYRCCSVEEGMRPVLRPDVERWARLGKRDFGYVSFYFERPAA